MIGTAALLGGAHLLKRAAELPQDGGHDEPNHPVMQWLGIFSIILFVVNFCVIVPLFFYFGYTLAEIYPTLAMIEDPAPPSYESLDYVEPFDEDATPPEVNQSANKAKTASENPLLSASAGNSSRDASESLTSESHVLTTSSLRRTHRLLMNHAGWRTNFRGYAIIVINGFVSTMLAGLFHDILPFMPSISGMAVGTLLATLATVQLSTAWTHCVISGSRAGSWFWLRRLPPFVKTFKATYPPILAEFAAKVIRDGPPMLYVMHGGNGSNPSGNHVSIWMLGVPLLTILWVLLVQVVAVYPAQVALVRVQASMLPAGEDTIVPFDRTFGGAVQPPSMGGTGYVGFKLALSTFSRSSWVRFYKMLGKIMAIILGAVMFFVVEAAIVFGIASLFQ